MFVVVYFVFALPLCYSESEFHRYDLSDKDWQQVKVNDEMTQFEM